MAMTIAEQNLVQVRIERRIVNDLRMGMGCSKVLIVIIKAEVEGTIGVVCTRKWSWYRTATETYLSIK